MDYLFEYLTKVIPINLLELLAAISGSYYLTKKNDFNKREKYLVYFLWFTIFIELIGAYAPIAFFTNYKYFGFIEDTVFKDNRWLYNIYSLVFYVFFIDYFRSFLQKNIIKKTFNVLIVFYLVIGILNLIINDEFYYSSAIFTSFAGTILLLLCIILFYLNLLNSDRILSLRFYLPIYVSIGVLVFNLTVTPLDIFSNYFNKENNMYIKLNGLILLGANIIMYTTFIIGFLVCAKNKKENLDVL